MTNWVGASSEELTAAYATGRASPVAVAEAYFSHIERRDRDIGAMRVLCRDMAMASAAASERRWQRGAPLSPLDGVPVTVREDMPLPLDAKDVHGAAPVVARLMEAGCLIMGKTVMAAHEALVSGRCFDGTLVRNPWAPALTTGGSSAGAAAACAAGYAPLHVGIDRVGSVRLPASFCGVFGFKPTQGRVPVSDPALGRTAGPMGRTVHDVSALMNILSRRDDRDFTSLPPDTHEHPMRIDGQSPKSLCIGLLTDMGLGLPVDPQIAQTVERAAHALQMAGASVDLVDSFLSAEMFDALQLYLETAVHTELLALSPSVRDKLPEFVRAWAARRASQASAVDLMGAWRNIMAMRAAISQLMSGYDYLLLPVSPVLPYAAERLSPSDDPADGMPHIICTAPWNLAENPAATFNWGHTEEGVPLGLQVVGHRFDDLGVLRLCRTLEIMRPDAAPWP